MSAGEIAVSGLKRGGELQAVEIARLGLELHQKLQDPLAATRQDAQDTNLRLVDDRLGPSLLETEVGLDPGSLDLKNRPVSCARLPVEGSKAHPFRSLNGIRSTLIRCASRRASNQDANSLLSFCEKPWHNAEARKSVCIDFIPNNKITPWSARFQSSFTASKALSQGEGLRSEVGRTTDSGIGRLIQSPKPPEG